MIDIAKLQIGDKVHYQPWPFDEWENGLVKEIPAFATDETAVVGYNCVRVVYNCGGNWDRFMDYTSALTDLNYLHLGWR